MIYQTFNFFLYPINWSAKVDTCKNGQCMTEPIELYDLFTRAVWYEIRKEHSNVPIDGIKKLNCQRILWYNKLTTQFLASTDSKSMCIQSVEQSINWFPNRFQSQSAPNNILIPKSYTTICVFRVCACSFFFSIIEWKSVAMNRDHIISYVRTHKKMCIAFYLNARLLE